MIGTSVAFRTRPWIGPFLGVFLGLLDRPPRRRRPRPIARAIRTRWAPPAPSSVDPRAHPRIDTMQYRETLPLEDHEVVLTFDDGPLPRALNQVLQILADECIKATFFIIGSAGPGEPQGVRKLVAAGHTRWHPQHEPSADVRQDADREGRGRDRRRHPMDARPR